MRVLVVRERDDGSVEEIEHRQLGTRLGEGLRDGGALRPAAIERTLAAVTEFVAVARSHGARIACIATSAMRRASDASVFARRVSDVSGVPLDILSGPAEAAASYRGATAGCDLGDARIAVLDIGGGSTECAVGRRGRVLDARSLEIGSVRVTERFPALAGAAPGAPAREAAREARAFVRATLAPLRALTPVSQVRCVAGTPLTIAAVIAESHVDRVSGSTLSRADVDATIERLLALDLARRRALPGMLPQRADIIVAGALVLSEALAALGAREGLLESNDLLLGYLLSAEAEMRTTE
ncbi:MAG: Ppx/GppA phosphatase family protein [Vulcanimicrobiaceae bacterium]